MRGHILYQEDMRRHTSWKAGGTAEKWVEAADLQDLADYLQQLPADEDVHWIGLGSNLLVRDGGLPGSTISTAALSVIEEREHHRLYVEAGVPSPKLARTASRLQLAGAEFLAGIPGTFGGALAMNAGAFGGETWPLVESVVTINAAGQLRTQTAADYHIAYRSVKPLHAEPRWFVSAIVQLQPQTDDNPPPIKHWLKKRSASQPIGQASCGSVFKNPPGQHAAQLIEQTGLKGFCIGKACVSDKHSNFIINQGNATATDIEALIQHIIHSVAQHFQITLQPEVRIIGNPDTPQTPL
jgi:UDP-N-acetylmuramate dehydrogenase